MRLIENINTLIRFCTYLLPLFFLVFGRGIIWKIMNKLSWHKEELKIIIYLGLLFIAALFAIIAIYKLFHFSNKKRYESCKQHLTTETRVKIAQLAEVDPTVETYFTENSEWIEQDINTIIEKYSLEVGVSDFEQFKQFVDQNAVVHFAHRVTNRKQFLDIINRLR